MNFDQPKIKENEKDENKFSAQNVQDAIMASKPIEVKVLRTGQANPEDGWEVWGINEQAGTAYVKKFGTEGKMIADKTVPLEQLKKWNS